MMHRNHCVSGMITGCLIATALPYAPLPLKVLVIPLCGGAALLPDLDQPGSKPSRSLGPITNNLAKLIKAGSLNIYHASRGPLDNPGREDGHRTFTHTLPGCAIPGVITGVAVWANMWAAVLVVALLVGLMAYSTPRVGFVFVAAGGLTAWWVMAQCPGWSWVWPIAVTLGAITHVLGDSCTNSGVPLLWPMERGGKRWGKVRTPATFETGKAIEMGAVTWAMRSAFVVALALASGLLAPLLVALYRMTVA